MLALRVADWQASFSPSGATNPRPAVAFCFCHAPSLRRFQPMTKRVNGSLGITRSPRREGSAVRPQQPGSRKQQIPLRSKNLLAMTNLLAHTAFRHSRNALAQDSANAPRASALIRWRLVLRGLIEHRYPRQTRREYSARRRCGRGNATAGRVCSARWRDGQS